jgi:hypothetical protein
MEEFLVNLEQFLINRYWTIVLLLVFWDLLWKAIALWKAARNTHKIWFIFLLISNTLAILPIIYIIFFDNKKIKETDTKTK